MSRLDIQINDNIATFRVIENDGTIGEASDLVLSVDHRFAKDENKLIISSRNTDTPPQVINFGVIQTDISGEQIIAKLAGLPDNVKLPYNIIKDTPNLDTITVRSLTNRIDNGRVVIVATLRDGNTIETTLPEAATQSVSYFSHIEEDYANNTDLTAPILPGSWDVADNEVDTLILKNEHSTPNTLLVYTKAKNDPNACYDYRGTITLGLIDDSGGVDLSEIETFAQLRSADIVPDRKLPSDLVREDDIQDFIDADDVEDFASTDFPNIRVPDRKLPTDLARTGDEKPASEITTSGLTTNLANVTNLHDALIILDTLATGGGTVSGITSAQALALIISWARSGNTDRIPKNKLPDDTAYTDQIPDVSDFITDSEVSTWAKTAFPDVGIPTSKIPERIREIVALIPTKITDEFTITTGHTFTSSSLGEGYGWSRGPGGSQFIQGGRGILPSEILAVQSFNNETLVYVETGTVLSELSIDDVSVNLSIRARNQNGWTDVNYDSYVTVGTPINPLRATSTPKTVALRFERPDGTCLEAEVVDFPEGGTTIEAYVKDVVKVQNENAFNVTIVVDGVESTKKITLAAAGTDGLNDEEVTEIVKREVYDWAEEGNTDDIPTSKIPDGLLTEGDVSLAQINFNEATVHGTNIESSNVPGVHTFEDFPTNSILFNTRNARNANNVVTGIPADDAQMTAVINWRPTGTLNGRSLFGVLTVSEDGTTIKTQTLHSQADNDIVINGIDNNKSYTFSINTRDEFGNQGIGATNVGRWELGNIRFHYEGEIHQEAVQIIRAEVADQLADVKSLLTNVQGIANRADQNSADAKRKTDLQHFANKFGDYEDFDFRVSLSTAATTKTYTNNTGADQNGLRIWVRFSGDGGLSDPLYQFRKDINGTISSLGGYVGADGEPPADRLFAFSVDVKAGETLKVERRSIRQTLAFLLRLGRVEEAIDILKSNQYVPDEKLVTFLTDLTFLNTSHPNDLPVRPSSGSKLLAYQSAEILNEDIAGEKFVPVDHNTNPPNNVTNSGITGRFVHNSLDDVEATLYENGSVWTSAYGNRQVVGRNGYQWNLPVNADTIVMISLFTIPKGNGVSEDVPLTTWSYDGLGGEEDLVVFRNNKIRGKVIAPRPSDSPETTTTRTRTQSLRFSSTDNTNPRYTEILSGHGVKDFWADVNRDEGRTYTIKIRNAPKDNIADGRTGVLIYTVTDPNVDQGESQHTTRLVAPGQQPRSEVIHVSYDANGGAGGVGRILFELPNGIDGNTEASSPNDLLITGSYDYQVEIPQKDDITEFIDQDIADFDINVPAVGVEEEPVRKMIEQYTRDTDGTWQYEVGFENAPGEFTFRTVDSGIPADSFNRMNPTKFRDGLSIWTALRIAYLSGPAYTRAELQALLEDAKFYSEGTDLAQDATKIAFWSGELLPESHTVTPGRDWFLRGDKIPAEATESTPTTIQAVEIGTQSLSIVGTTNQSDWITTEIEVPDLATVGDYDLFSVSFGRPIDGSGQTGIYWFNGEQLKELNALDDDPDSANTRIGQSIYDDKENTLTFRSAYSDDSFQVADFYLGIGESGNFMFAIRAEAEDALPFKIVQYKSGTGGSSGGGATITNAPINVASPTSEPVDEGASRRSIATAVAAAGKSDSEIVASINRVIGNQLWQSRRPEISNSEVKTKYEANSNTEAFTTAEKTKLGNTEVFTQTEKTKLDNIETRATADQSDAEIVQAVDNVIGNEFWKSRRNLNTADLNLDTPANESNSTVTSRRTIARALRDVRDAIPDLSDGFHTHRVGSAFQLGNITIDDQHIDIVVITAPFTLQSVSYATGDVWVWDTAEDEWVRISSITVASDVSDAEISIDNPASESTSSGASRQSIAEAIAVALSRIPSEARIQELAEGEILDWAETGNTSFIPDNKVVPINFRFDWQANTSYSRGDVVRVKVTAPDDVPSRDGLYYCFSNDPGNVLAPGNGHRTGWVNNWRRLQDDAFERWARKGDDTPIPAEKLVNAPQGSGEAVATNQINIIFYIANTSGTAELTLPDSWEDFENVVVAVTNKGGTSTTSDDSWPIEVLPTPAIRLYLDNSSSARPFGDGDSVNIIPTESGGVVKLTFANSNTNNDRFLFGKLQGNVNVPTSEQGGGGGATITDAAINILVPSNESTSTGASRQAIAEAFRNAITSATLNLISPSSESNVNAPTRRVVSNAINAAITDNDIDLDAPAGESTRTAPSRQSVAEAIPNVETWTIKQNTDVIPDAKIPAIKVQRHRGDVQVLAAALNAARNNGAPAHLVIFQPTIDFPFDSVNYKANYIYFYDDNTDRFVFPVASQDVIDTLETGGGGDGSRWSVVDAVPSNSDGEEDDFVFVINAFTRSIYRRLTSTWIKVIDIPAASSGQASITDTDLNIESPSSESTTVAASRQAVAEAIESVDFRGSAVTAVTFSTADGTIVYTRSPAAGSNVGTTVRSTKIVNDAALNRVNPASESVNEIASRQAIAEGLKAVADTIPSLSDGFHVHRVVNGLQLSDATSSTTDSQIDIVIITGNFTENSVVYAIGDTLIWDSNADAWVKIGSITVASDVTNTVINIDNPNSESTTVGASRRQIALALGVVEDGIPNVPTWVSSDSVDIPKNKLDNVENWAQLDSGVNVPVDHLPGSVLKWRISWTPNSAYRVGDVVEWFADGSTRLYVCHLNDPGTTSAFPPSATNQRPDGTFSHDYWREFIREGADRRILQAFTTTGVANVDLPVDYRTYESVKMIVTNVNSSNAVHEISKVCEIDTDVINAYDNGTTGGANIVGVSRLRLVGRVKLHVQNRRMQIVGDGGALIGNARFVKAWLER